MILKASQRGGARQLAVHLLKQFDNDHVEVHELRGFMAESLQGALDEARAVAGGTRCRQFLFSLSLNPPEGSFPSTEMLVAAADRAEEAVGLKDQPRAIVIHEKDGRRHAHVVWSRIDPQDMKAINLPHFKNRLKDLSKELYLENGWDLPDGHKENGWKNPLNFTLAEWQQAKRLDLDPREVKQIFQSAWQRSDNIGSLRHALEEHGYFLAKGDRRGVVAVDLQGNIFSLARWTGVKTKDVNAKMGHEPRLPTISEVIRDKRFQTVRQLQSLSADHRQEHREKLESLVAQQAAMTLEHREERQLMGDRQQERWSVETAQRAARFKRGLGAVLDLLTGRLFKTRRENERDAYQGFLRDRAQRQRLFDEQLDQRWTLEQSIRAIQREHREVRARAARNVIALWRRIRVPDYRTRDFGLELER